MGPTEGGGVLQAGAKRRGSGVPCGREACRPARNEGRRSRVARNAQPRLAVAGCSGGRTIFGGFLRLCSAT